MFQQQALYRSEECSVIDNLKNSTQIIELYFDLTMSIITRRTKEGKNYQRSFSYRYTHVQEKIADNKKNCWKAGCQSTIVLFFCALRSWGLILFFCGTGFHTRLPWSLLIQSDWHVPCTCQFSSPLNLTRYLFLAYFFLLCAFQRNDKQFSPSATSLWTRLTKQLALKSTRRNKLLFLPT